MCPELVEARDVAPLADGSTDGVPSPPVGLLHDRAVRSHPGILGAVTLLLGVLEGDPDRADLLGSVGRGADERRGGVAGHQVLGPCVDGLLERGRLGEQAVGFGLLETKTALECVAFLATLVEHRVNPG